MAKNSIDCDDLPGPSRTGFDPSMDCRRCLQKDLSTRSEVAQTAPTASVRSDLIGAWLKAASQSCPLNRPATTLREAGMLEVTDHQHRAALRVVIGIDTHQKQHVAVAIDRQGIRQGEWYAAATTSGYRELERWSSNLGTIHAFGIEGTGSYGAGIAPFLTSLGYCVVEVNRPDRSTRYRKGKSDATDAEMAARAVLPGVADAIPTSGQGEVEMIRILKSARDFAVKARTQAINQMKALIVTAPADLRETLDGLSISALAARCRSFRVRCLSNPPAAVKYALRSLACRHYQLSVEIRNLKAELAHLIGTVSPTLINIVGVGPDTAATLLIAAGSNPERLRSEVAFAALCGVCPIPASSGGLADVLLDILAFTALPVSHWQKLWSNNPLERLNKEIRRRTDVVVIFPNRGATRRLVGIRVSER